MAETDAQQDGEGDVEDETDAPHGAERGASDDAAPVAARGPGFGDGPYPGWLDQQLLTPRAPMAPGAGMRVYPLPIIPQPGGSVPAQWAADPTARHEWRWWNGFDWTDQVADGGRSAIDPPT